MGLGFKETLRLQKIAQCGSDGNGSETIWRFSGCPIVKTVPKRYRPFERDLGWSPFPEAFVLKDGKWEQMQDRSRLPGFHPAHCCGLFCDGQDGNGQCNDQKMDGPPSISPLQGLVEGVFDDYDQSSIAL